MCDNKNKNKKIIIFAVFVIALLIILSFITPLGTYLYNEDVRYMRNAEEYLNNYYPLNEEHLQGASLMLNFYKLNNGSRLSPRLKNLNDAFIDIYDEVDLALYYKDGSYYGAYYLMNYHINRSISKMEYAIGILEDL